MVKTSEDPTVTKRLSAEHRHLSKATQQLRALAMGPVTAEGFAFWRQDLRARLGGFRRLLLDHFEHEEDGGFLRDVLAKVPNSQSKVEALRDEHDNIERRLDTVLDDLERLEATDDPGPIQQQVEDLTNLLVQHETEEQHLVQRTYYREYGGE